MITLEFKTIPPSANGAFTTLRTGRRIKTAEGKRYENETKVSAVKQLLLHPNLDHSLGYNFVYLVEVTQDEMFNKGWPKTKERYKQWDISNRCKLFEDAVKQALGIDDACFVRVCGWKRVGQPGTKAWIWSPEQEWASLDEILGNTPMKPS